MRSLTYVFTWRSIHKDASRWVDTDLLIEFEVSKGQFHSFFHLLFLHVHTADVRVGNVRLLVRLKSNASAN